MVRLAKALSRKRLERPLYIILCISLALLLTITFFAPSVIAWFKKFISVNNDAQLTNFVTKIEYSLNGNAWNTVSPDDPIRIHSENIGNLQIRISYSGIHKSYLRVKLHGDYVNRHSGTHLPSSEELFTPTGGTGWQLSDGYYYFTSRLGMSSVTGEEATTTQTLGAFKVSSSLPAGASSYQEYDVELYVMVDAVQCDRYDELWGISPLSFMS